MKITKIKLYKRVCLCGCGGVFKVMRGSKSRYSSIKCMEEHTGVEFKPTSTYGKEHYKNRKDYYSGYYSNLESYYYAIGNKPINETKEDL